jgi:parallel beta-helix repeat protein
MGTRLKTLPCGVALATLALLGVCAAADREQPGAPTVLSSPLAADTTLAGNVTVTIMLNVPSGVTLTVLPGADVRFAAGAGLLVAGTLRAEATAEQPVVFAAAADGARRGSWAGISFVGTAGSSSLRHCRILGAEAVSITAGEHTVEDCVIADGPRGLVVSGKEARPFITRNRLHDLAEGGIACLSGSAPRVRGNTIERCGPFGISVSQGAAAEIRENLVSECASGVELAHSEPLIRENTIRRCARGIALTYAGGGRPVLGNRLEENEIGIYVQQFSAPEIRENVIVGGKTGIYCFMGAHPLITGNTITGAGTGIVCTQLAQPLIEGNLVENSGTGIVLNLSSYAIIRRNNLVGNKVQLELGNMSLDWERRAGGKKPPRGRQLQHLERVKQGQDVPGQETADGFDMSTSLIDARDNWWGEQTTRELAEKGPDANISAFIDGYDVPVRTYEGFEGEYAQDKITYAPWSVKPFVLAVPAPRPADAAPRVTPP